MAALPHLGRRAAVVSIGDLCVDHYASYGRLFPGGQAFNFAANVRRLGLTAALATCVGTDFWGSWLLDRAALAGVDCGLSERRVGRSFVTTVQHADGIERQFVREEEGATAEWAVSDEALAAASHSRLVYITPWARAGSRLSLVRGKRAPLVAFDCMDLSPDGPLPSELPFVDIAFVPVTRSGEQPLVRRITGEGPRLVIVSRGKDGSAVYDAGHLVSELPAPPTQVVDTLGAGDALAAAFCAARLRLEDVSAAHRSAVVYAAAACSHFGGTLGPRGEWDVRLRRRSEDGGPDAR